MHHPISSVPDAHNSTPHATPIDVQARHRKPIRSRQGQTRLCPPDSHAEPQWRRRRCEIYPSKLPSVPCGVLWE